MAMRWREVSDSVRPVAQTSALIGDRWTLLILREALQGARRFESFEKVLGVSPHLLSVRLKRLVAEGMMRQDDKKHYRLTRPGIALQPVILAMAVWGNQWRSDNNGPQTRFFHTDCGQEFVPQVVCSACNLPVDPDAVRTEFSAALLAVASDPQVKRTSSWGMPGNANIDKVTIRPWLISGSLGSHCCTISHWHQKNDTVFCVGSRRSGRRKQSLSS